MKIEPHWNRRPSEAEPASEQPYVPQSPPVTRWYDTPGTWRWWTNVLGWTALAALALCVIVRAI